MAMQKLFHEDNVVCGVNVIDVYLVWIASISE